LSSNNALKRKIGWGEGCKTPFFFIIVIFVYFLKECALATLLLLLLHRRIEDSTNSLIEDLLETLLCKGGALEILVSADLLCLGHTILVCDGATLMLLAELLDGILVIAKIEFCANKHDGDLCAVVRNLREPLGSHVLERRRADD